MVPGHVVHEAAFVVRLYLLTAQFVQPVFAVAEHAEVSDVPGWHTVQVVQLVAPAEDQVPAAQLLQAMFAVALHAAEMYVPAAQEPHVVHGARPLALYVDPGTQERIVHVALVAFQA